MTNNNQYNACVIFERRRGVALQQTTLRSRVSRWLLAQTDLRIGRNPEDLWRWSEPPRCLSIEITGTPPSQHGRKLPLEADFKVDVVFCFCEDPIHISLGDEEEELSAMAQWEMPHIEHHGMVGLSACVQSCALSGSHCNMTAI